MIIAATSQGPSLWQSGVVAALVAAAVSLTTLWATGRRARLERQRKLFGEAFEACIAYREFAYIVRRRRPDDGPGERVRISGEMSEVQRRLRSFEAVLRVEAPRLARSYSDLVAATRRVAGPQISKGWDETPAGDEAVHVKGVDFSELTPCEDRYLVAVRDHVGLAPWWLTVVGRWVLRRRSGDCLPQKPTKLPMTQ
jgi:hypothetical protein